MKRLKLLPFLGTLFVITFLNIENTNCSDVDGGWSSWAVYQTTCDKECGGGNLKKFRSCTNPEPQGNGKKCYRNATQDYDVFETKNVPCNTHQCFNGTMSEWFLCDNCTVGQQYRISMCGNETCEEDFPQYKIEYEDCNRWNKSYCPSACINVTCPEYGTCKDISTELKPMSKCVCTMGYMMNKKKTACIVPPPASPTPRPIPTLPAAQKTVATVMSKSASIVLIVFVTITLVLFLLLRVFTPDRVIQMNMEIALLLAHIFLMFPSETAEVPFLCKFISMLIHWCFTACYMFMLLEALHMFFMVAYVVKKDGAFSRLQNIVIGWGIPFLIVLFNICFEYDNYGAEYHCWLQLNKPLAYGVFIPIIIMVIITFTLIEAAGASEYKPLPGIDEHQRASAKISQRTNLILLPFILAHWIIGMFSEYEQNLALYGTFSILNGVTGFLVFFFHCTNNQEVRSKLVEIFKKVSKKK